MSNDERLERAYRIINSFVEWADDPPDEENGILDEIVESGRDWLIEQLSPRSTKEALGLGDLK